MIKQPPVNVCAGGGGYGHGRTGQPDNLAFARWAVGSPARWAVTSSGEVDQMRSIVGPLIPTFKTKIVYELLNPRTSHQSLSFVILLIRECYLYPSSSFFLDSQLYKRNDDSVSK